MAVLIHRKTHWEDTPLTIMARVKNPDADDVLEADLASISLKAFNLTDGTQVGDTTALTVADVIFDTLQTDYQWDDEAYPDGYNFRYEVAGTFFATGGQLVQIEVIGTATSSGKTYPLWVGVIDVQALESS